MNLNYSIFSKTYLFFIIFIILFCVLFTTISINNESIIIVEPSEFYWPLPNNHTITSPFGPRRAPTSGASSSHSGTDIAATPGTPIHSICDGYVIFTGFKGAGGFSITIKASPYKVSYCHVNPNYIVSINEFVSKGQIIGHVGPKYVDYPSNYYDGIGYTNGATTGPHLHITIWKNDKLINPESLYQ